VVCSLTRPPECAIDISHSNVSPRLYRISRDDDGSQVHFFSSHFYSALVKEGPKGVSRWTEKKGVDIFKKKFIFVPVNKSLHWSQCVIVNPGAIMQHGEWFDAGFSDESGFDEDAPFPLFLFLDSLKAHQKKQVAKNLRAWLNSEWKRLRKSDELTLEPFAPKKMIVFSPKIK
jgi:ubiquitin-like-specific protease 1C/D